jgi:hypothetical protein
VLFLHLCIGGDLSKPLDCVLIDFQISRAVPAVIDLLYFFYSSTEQELRRKHMDDLLKIYWESAREILRERGITYPGRLVTQIFLKMLLTYNF